MLDLAKFECCLSFFISGLNQSFKNKLEGLFGGNVPQGKGAPKGSRTLPQPHINRQISEDHEYQELPDIPPDAVTYANEKYNVDNWNENRNLLIYRVIQEILAAKSQI